MAAEKLVDVTPWTRAARGGKPEPGLVHIVAAAAADQWVLDHAAELLEEGYVNVTVTEHVPSTVVGDRRRRRK